MFSQHIMFVIFAFLNTYTAKSSPFDISDDSPNEPAIKPNYKDILSFHQSVWNHLEKKAKVAPADKSLYYENVLEQCKVQATDDNYRVIIDVEDNTKDDLHVVLKNNFLIAVKTRYEKFKEVINDKMVINKVTFTEVRTIPNNSDVSAATATLTSDGYLVVDVPIGAQAAELKGERMVPVVESGKLLEGGIFKTKRPTIMYQDDENIRYSIYWLFKYLARHYKVQSQIEATEDNFRVIIKPNVTKITNEDLVVSLNDGFLYINPKSLERIDKEKKNMVIESYMLPPNSVFDSITSTLTSDGYLVIDIPVDEQVAGPALGYRQVAIMQSEEPLEELKVSTAAVIVDNDNKDKEDNDNKEDDDNNDNDNKDEDDNDNKGDDDNDNKDEEDNDNKDDDDNVNKDDDDNENKNVDEDDINVDGDINSTTNANRNSTNNEKNDDNDNDDDDDTEDNDNRETELTTIGDTDNISQIEE